MFFKKTANALSSLQDMIRLCMFSFVGGFANKLEMANLMIVDPSVKSSPNLDSRSFSLSLETLWTSPKVSSEILNPIVLMLPRL